MNIPLSHPDITQREIDAVVDVLHSGTLSLGPKVVEFENKVAAVAGRKHGIAVSSGTSGLHCCMLAAGVGPGDEVVTTPFSFVASANCILFVGATPAFADIESRTMNVDLDKLEAAITPRTKAIVGVETFGHPGGMAELESLARRRGLALIEDSCEGFGGRSAGRAVGSFGLASVFAFYPNKQITTGEGGMIVTDDEEVAATCRALRNQGREGMAWLAHQQLGYNYRLDEISSALGCVQVDRLDEILESRRRVAQLYMSRLLDNRYLILPTIDEPASMSWFVFVVRLSDLFGAGDRDEIIRQLRAEGIGCNNYFPPIHLQPYMAEKFGFSVGDFPVCEYIASRTLALPFGSKLSAREVDHVCSRLDAILERVLTTGRKRT